MRILLVLLAASCAWAQTAPEYGARVLSGSFTPPRKTVATLPAAASSTNQVFLVTNGNAAGDCTTGGGSSRTWCVSNGSIWVSLGDGNTGGSGTAGTFYLNDAGANDTYTGNLQTVGLSAASSTALLAYTDGLTIWFRPNTSNTGACTVNVNGLGAKAIKLQDGVTDPDTGSVVAGYRYPITYDGTVFRVNLLDYEIPAGDPYSTTIRNAGGINVASFANGGPDAGTIAVTGASSTLDCGTTAETARRNVNFDPDGTYTLTSTPTIADSFDGALCTLTNLDTSLSLTLSDEASTASSNLRLGGSNVTIGPRGSITLKFVTDLGVWVRADVPGTSTTPTSAVVKAATPVTSFSPGTANNASVTISVDFDTYTAGDQLVCVARWTKGTSSAANFASGIGGSNSATVASGATNTFFITEHWFAQTSAGNQIWHAPRMLRGSAVPGAGDVPAAMTAGATATGATNVTLQGWTTGGETLVLQAYICTKIEAVP